MTLDTVRARRHYLALNRIADERMRRGRSKPVTPRAPSSTTLVIRESDDDASGSPATITRLSTSIVEDNYFNIDGQKRIGTFIEKIVHKSGPVLVAPAFGPDDLGRDGSIVIKSVGDDDQPYGTEDPEDPETPTDPAAPPPTPTTPTTGGTTP